MSTGTMHTGGFTTGAARPGACATHLVYAGIAAPIATKTWHDGTNGKQVSPVFNTDRPARRPLERFP